LVSVTKGIEFETGETMSRILREHAPANRVAALSGPSFAREVALGIPTTVVCACESDGTAKTVQGLFHRPEFRIYRSTDVLGVEYGGALKNIIAIGAGVSDGLGYGDNTKAGLVTRALVRNAPAGRGVRRAGGNLFRLERPGRPDADVFFKTKPQPRFGRTAGARRNDGGDPGVASETGGGLSHGALGAPAGAGEKGADADH
jgi:hypothetical protein